MIKKQTKNSKRSVHPWRAINLNVRKFKMK